MSDTIQPSDYSATAMAIAYDIARQQRPSIFKDEKLKTHEDRAVAEGKLVHQVYKAILGGGQK
jgi:hypothetical protein